MFALQIPIGRASLGQFQDSSAGLACLFEARNLNCDCPSCNCICFYKRGSVEEVYVSKLNPQIDIRHHK